MVSPALSALVMAMLPCLASVPDDWLMTIIKLDKKRLSHLDVFHGDFHTESVAWSIAPKDPGGPIYILARIEMYSPFIGKVLFGHLTVAKFTWHTAWESRTLHERQQEELDNVGRRLSLLVNNLSLSSIGPRSPLNSFMWHGKMDRTYSKDRIIQNYNHPMYQRHHVLRTDVAKILIDHTL